MSKKSRAKSKEKRAAEKRKRKAAQRALYASYRDAGQNAKSYRARKQAKKAKMRTRRHASGPCGNIGCQKCSPQYPPHPRMDRPLEGYRVVRAA